MPPLLRLARDVLDELCQTRVTRSSVLLAEQLWARGRIKEAGDPAGLVQLIVEQLCADGLVTYTVGDHEVPVQIKVTQKGFKRAGYAVQVPAVGSSAALHQPLRAEPSDFRGLASMTTGGDIERMPLAEHLTVYPQHRSIHPDPWEVGPDSVTRRDDMVRTSKVSKAGALRARDVLADMDHPASSAEIAARLGLAQVTAQSMLQRAIDEGLVERIGSARGPGIRYAIKGEIATPPIDESSTRDAIVDILTHRAGVADADAMLRLLQRRDTRRWGGLGLHALQHQLWAMQKAGLIRFDDHRQGSIVKITNIRIGRIVTAAVEPEGLTETDVAPEPDVPVGSAGDSSWPLLDEARAKAQRLLESEATAHRYLQAAELLESIDPAESERLLLRAAEASSETLSPIEAEYIRFAAEKGATR